MSKKEFTYRDKLRWFSDKTWNEKYPITSSVTGNKYLIKIKPFYGDDTKYKQGCVVSLRKNNLFHTILREDHFKNKDGKINIEHYYGKDTETDWEYNLIEMTKLIVKLYERSKNLDNTSKLQLDKDYEEFEKWDGIA
jgi:hypothetical protein